MSIYVSGQWNAICTSCEQQKTIDKFYLHSNGKPRKQCKECHLQRNKQWAQENREARRESARKIYKKNPELCLARTRDWRKANLEYDAFRAKVYRTRKTRQLASWADLDKIKEFYLNCPKGYHVDHIIPLKGKLVSGLHVETNLQLLPAHENLKKRNLYNVD